ncbi:MAG: hypothetical protein JW714_03015 [Candidatus Omnitrophica bacterium]|nr:hypothetical protein [Candidatus Omnitrophota bacterium]
MIHSADDKSLIRQFSIILLIVLALYLALVRPLAKQGVNILQGEINETVTQLEKFIPQEQDAFLPKREFVQILKNNLLKEQENYQALKKFIDPEKTYLPPETQEPGLYLIEQLHTTTKRLKRQASSLKINIPDNFGFSKEMSEDTANVELHLKELEMVDRIATLLMEEGVGEISLVKPLSPIEQRDQLTQELLFQELPIQLSFLCNSSVLVKLLYQFKNFSPALVVRDIVIRRRDGDFLQVEMVLSRLVA